jgi:hypothetical protein
MKSIHFLLLALVLALLSISLIPAEVEVGLDPELHLGLLDARAGISPETGKPSGWYTSDVTLRVISPADVLVNGKPLKNGQITLTEEGQHKIVFQLGPTGQTSLGAQFVSIDKTPPRVTWRTVPQGQGSMSLILDAEVQESVSGICAIEASFDHGESWDRQSFPAPAPGKAGDLHETNWSMQLDLFEFSQGAYVVLLRAHDCAGNVSPGEILVFRVE